MMLVASLTISSPNVCVYSIHLHIAGNMHGVFCLFRKFFNFFVHNIVHIELIFNILYNDLEFCQVVNTMGVEKLLLIFLMGGDFLPMTAGDDYLEQIAIRVSEKK